MTFAANKPPFRAASPVHVLLLLTLLWPLGCKRRNSEVSTEPGEPPLAKAKSELIPLTNMVLLKAGTYLRIKFPVTISRDFWIGRYEVIQREYEAVAGKNPSHFPGDGNRPVEKVSYVDAVAYCQGLTKREREAGRLPTAYQYRLPTEGEWEFACVCRRCAAR